MNMGSRAELFFKAQWNFVKIDVTTLENWCLFRFQKPINLTQIIMLKIWKYFISQSDWPLIYFYIFHPTFDHLQRLELIPFSIKYKCKMKKLSSNCHECDFLIIWTVLNLNVFPGYLESMVVMKVASMSYDVSRLARRQLYRNPWHLSLAPRPYRLI